MKTSSRLLLIIVLLLAALLATAAAAQAAAWDSPVTVTSQNATDLEAAIVNGHPAVVYYNDTNKSIMYVRATDANGSAWGTPVTIATNAIDVWYTFVSLAVVDGNPAIAYSKNDTIFTGSVQYVRATDADGTSWGTPVSIASHQIYSLKLAVINGNPAVAYQNADTVQMHYARATDASGSAWGAPVLVDSGYAGGQLDLMEVNGRPAIGFGFFDATWELYYVRASDANGATWPAKTLVDNTLDRSGEYLSMEIVNGNPAMAYRRDLTSTQSLMYVRASNADGSSWGSPQTLETAAGSAAATSLTIVNGNPAILSCQGTAVRYTRADDASGAAWSIAGAISGATCSSLGGVDLIIVNGNPAAFHTGSVVYRRASSPNALDLTGFTAAPPANFWSRLLGWAESLFAGLAR